MIYLVEKVNNLGENVETSSWVDWGLIEDACLWIREIIAVSFGDFSNVMPFFPPILFLICTSGAERNMF